VKKTPPTAAAPAPTSDEADSGVVHHATEASEKEKVHFRSFLGYTIHFIIGRFHETCHKKL
jgi:hypothetical protein